MTLSAVCAPNNVTTYLSKALSCAGQAAKAHWMQIGLDSHGLIPGEATALKSAQIVGGILSGSLSASEGNLPGAGMSGGGEILTVLDAEKANIPNLGKNLAEAIPIAGMGASAIAIGYDIFGSKEYASCMSQ